MHKFDTGGSARQIAYHEYLRSDHWRDLKKRKKEETPKVCAACGDKEKIQLHHMRYRETFEETELRDTCWLCKGCHTSFHHRAGMRVKDCNDSKLLLKTILIINRGTTRGPDGTITTKLTRRQQRARIKAEKIALGLIVPKIRVDRRNNKQRYISQMNYLISQIKPRSPLKSTLAGKAIAVRPT